MSESSAGKVVPAASIVEKASSVLDAAESPVSLKYKE